MTELNNGQGIAGDAPSPKRPVQKKWIVLGVVVAVIVVGRRRLLGVAQHAGLLQRLLPQPHGRLR